MATTPTRRDLGFLDILEARDRGKDSLNEASLNRVHQHVADKEEGGSFGILTSWRSANPKKTNVTNMERLQQDLRSMGLGFFKMKGHWRECTTPGMPYSQCEETDLKDVVEPSLFVPGISHDQVEMLRSKYEQDSVVYAGPETDGSVTLMFNDGTKADIGHFNPHKIAQAYSTVKGSNFTFEGFEYPAQSFTEGMMEKWFTKRTS